MRALIAALLLCACRSAPQVPVAPAAPRSAGAVPQQQPLDAGAPQPGKVIAEVNGTAVLALAAPRFAQVSRDQRLLALAVAQAGAAGESVALDQSWRHNLTLVHILRGILGSPFVVPPALLPRIRAFARVVWLDGGLHDPRTGRKRAPPFTAADLRTAALAAQAAGADFRLGTVSLELALRALEGPLFDPGIDALRTARGADLSQGAVKPVIRIPAAAAALDQALFHAAPPQRAVLEPLAALLRGGEPEPFRAAQRAWVEAAGPVDFFAGFFDRSADPRGRNAIFGSFVGVKDDQRTALLQQLAQLAPRLEEKLPWDPAERRPFARPAAAEALFLVAASGTMRPLRSFAVTLPLDAVQRDAAGVKTALFAGAEEAAARLRTDAALRTLADPRIAPQLARCLPELRFAFLALREIAGRPAGRAPQGDPAEQLQDGFGALSEARADLAAHFLSQDPLLEQAGLPGGTCRPLWPQFAATSWLAGLADVPEGERIDDDRSRALGLQIGWFTSKGALVERHDGPRRFFAVPDASRFHAAAGELLQVLHEIERTGDGARLTELLKRHASRLDTGLRDQVVERLRAAGIPRRMAVIAPQIRAVLVDGKIADAEAVPVEDLDAQILRDWQDL